ncbi:hypothetical protein HY971_02030 [Candidatus Kaiserbacteria bacterium]|nr:hypothetical protein [Candidatus Kaiserbacteria bacterium]
MARLLSLFASTFLPFSIAVLAVAAVPIGGMNLPQQQGILTAFAFGIALCIYAVAVIFNTRFSFRPIVLLGVPIVLVAAFSSIQTQAGIYSVFGNGFEPGTVGSLVLFAAAIAIGFSALSRAPRWFLYTYLMAGVVGAFGAAFLWFGLDVLKPLSGTWPHLSYVLCSTALLAALLFDRDGPGRRRGVYGAAATVLLGGFAAFFDPAAAGIGIAMGIIAVILTLASDKGSAYSQFPFATAFASILLLTFLMFGLGQPRGTTVNAYPSFLATQLIIGPAYTHSLGTALFGTGPNSFSYAWNAYRPQEINMTPLWNFDPVSSYSTITTFAVTLGMLGLFALFLGPAVLVVRFLSKAGEVSLSHIAVEEQGVFEACFVLCCFLFLSMLWYPVGVPLFVMAGLSLGFSLRFLFTQELHVFRELSPWVRYCIVVLLIGAGAVFMWVSAHQFAGAWYHGQAATMINADAHSNASAAPLFEKAADAWPTAEYQIHASNADAAAALSLVSSTMSGKDANTTELNTAINKSVGYSDRATVSDPRDYRVWLARASLYILLAQFSLPNAADAASGALYRAALLAPVDPRVPYTRAFLDQVKGDTAAAAVDIQRALDLKPDYQDALKWGLPR